MATWGIRTRDLPACSAVPQPTVPKQTSTELLCGDGFMDFIHRPKSKILKN
jgi:hypothetical protein